MNERSRDYKKGRNLANKTAVFTGITLSFNYLIVSTLSLRRRTKEKSGGTLSLKNLSRRVLEKILYPSVPSRKPCLPSLDQRLASFGLANFVFGMVQCTHSYLSNYILPSLSCLLALVFLFFHLPVPPSSFSLYPSFYMRLHAHRMHTQTDVYCCLQVLAHFLILRKI